jgi:aspartate/methionine/tyrosine aminotransferase
MSKTFAMPGVRTGWLITKQKDIYDKLVKLKDYTSLCASAPSEILTLIALRARGKIIKRNLDILNKNLKILDSFFDKYSNFFSWVRPKATTICFPKINADINSSDFCEDILQNAQVMLSPSAMFDYGEKHFRLGFGRLNMPEALNAFETYLKKIVP